MSQDKCCIEKWAGHECHCDCEKEIDKWKALAGEDKKLLIAIRTWAKANGHKEIERLCESQIAKAREAGL